MKPCLWPAGHPVTSLAWCCGSWGPGTPWADALVPLCAVPSCPWGRHHAVPVYRLEQRMAQPGLLHSVPIPSASLGTSPSLCHARWLGCHTLSQWGLRMAPPGPGGSAGPCPQQRPCLGAVCARGDGVLGHRGLLAPRPPSADTAANIPSWLFIFRIPWQGRDCKQLIFSQGHLHPMALLRSHHGVVGCLEPLRTWLTPAPGPGPRSGAMGGSRGHPSSAPCCPQVPARCGGDAQPHRGEGPRASGG